DPERYRDRPAARRRRLRHAALRRRPLHGDAWRLHRDAVLAALRLADGQRHVVLDPRGLGAASPHRLAGTSLDHGTMRGGTWAWRGFGGLVMLFMLSPLALVVLFSFGESALTAFPIRGLTFHWYRALAANDSFWPALRNSLIVAGSVGACATVVG